MAGLSDRVDQLRLPKAAELIASQLRREIVRGDLAENEALPSETVLMENFMVSRPTLREAFRILESEGLLSVRRGARGGARVHKPQPDAAARYAAHVLQSQGALLSDVFAARQILEGPAVEMLGAQPPAGALERLREINERGESVDDDPIKFLVIHHEFHGALVDLSGNLTISLMRNMIHNILDAANELHVSGRSAADEIRSSRRAQRTHVKLVELMSAGELEAADKLWRSHLEESAKIILSSSRAKTALDLMP